MSFYGLFKGVGANGFGYNTTTDAVTDGLDLSGKTYLLTGCNSGLGEETLRILTERGARVIGAARTIEKATAACAAAPGEAVGVACELSEPDSVRAAVETIKALGFPLDGIIANAGIMALPELNQQLGYEMQFFTNHVGHFILVTGLLDQLTDEGRVVMLSSDAHRRAYPEGVRLDDLSGETGKYSAWGAYGQSKISNMLFARHLSTRLPKPGQTANSVHPGVIATNLTRHMPLLIRGAFSGLGPAIGLKSVKQGAATQTWAATHPDAGSINGEYLADCNVSESTAQGQDKQLAAELWAATERIVASL